MKNRPVQYAFLILLIALQSKLSFGFQPISSLKSTFEVTSIELPLESTVSLNSATDLEISEEGYLYVSTSVGLLRYDGFYSDLFSFQNASGFLTDRISKVFLIQDRVIVNDQLGYMYEFVADSAFHITKPDSDERLRANQIYSQSNDIVFIRSGSSLYMVNENSTTELFELDQFQNIWSITTLGQGLVIATNLGVYHYDYDNGLTSKIEIEGGLNFENQTSLFSTEGNLFISNQNIIVRYDTLRKSSKNIDLFQNNTVNLDVYSIDKSKISDENTFIARTSNGLYKISEKGSFKIAGTQKALRYSGYYHVDGQEVFIAENGILINDELVFETNNYIQDAVQDNSGSIWFTVSGEGIYKLTKSPFSTLNIPDLTNVYSIVQASGGAFWVGTFNSGVFKVSNTQYEQFSNADSFLPNNTVRMLYALPDNRIILSLWGEPIKTIKFDTLIEEPSFSSLFGDENNVVEGFYVNDNGTWWIGSINGLFTKAEQNYSKFFDKAGNTISNINRIKSSPFNDDLYFCTEENGLIILQDGLFRFISTDTSFDKVHCRDVYSKSSDTLWVTTYEHGIHQYIVNENDVQYTILDESDGLKTTAYHDILKDENQYLWISTNAGLLRIPERNIYQLFNADLESEFDGEWFLDNPDNFLEFNGGTQTSSLIDSNQNFWFSSSKGVISFDPATFPQISDSLFELNINHLTTPSREIGLLSSDEIVLQNNESEITIRVSHLSLVNNQTRNLWAKLNNRPWQKFETSDGFRFTNLKSGAHNLHFASHPNEANIISSINFNKQPRFYETIAFKLFLLSGLILSFVFLFIRLNSKPNHASIVINEEVKNAEASITRDPILIILSFIEENYTSQKLTTQLIADELGYSRSKLYRIWNEKNEDSINDFIVKKRLQSSIKFVIEDDYTISEAAESVGFSSQSYFTKVFKKYYQATPKRYFDNLK